MSSAIHFSDVSDVTRKVMRANVNKDTKPELVVRRLLHAMGYRFRLHRNDLPGQPDIILPRHKKIIQVNGCFWHLHASPTCQKARLPKTRASYWREKLERNRDRDVTNVSALNQLGWKVLTLWECELSDLGGVRNVLESFMRESGEVTP